MISDVLFVLDNVMAMKICRAWRTHSEDPLVIARIVGGRPKIVKSVVEQMKEVGILLPGNKLEDHVEKYIDTYIASRIRSMTGGHT